MRSFISAAAAMLILLLTEHAHATPREGCVGVHYNKHGDGCGCATDPVGCSGRNPMRGDLAAFWDSVNRV